MFNSSNISIKLINFIFLFYFNFFNLSTNWSLSLNWMSSLLWILFIPSMFRSIPLTLTLALPLWLSFMLFGWINNTIHMFAHLVLQCTPPILMRFMVCIESISNIIRPDTLAIRLSPNMFAGHLLMTLLGNTGPMISLIMLNMLIIVQLLLLLLESAVAIIQSYVFAVLSTLYSSEVT